NETLCTPTQWGWRTARTPAGDGVRGPRRTEGKSARTRGGNLRGARSCFGGVKVGRRGRADPRGLLPLRDQKITSAPADSFCRSCKTPSNIPFRARRGARALRGYVRRRLTGRRDDNQCEDDFGLFVIAPVILLGSSVVADLRPFDSLKGSGRQDEPDDLHRLGVIAAVVFLSRSVVLFKGGLVLVLCKRKVGVVQLCNH